MVGEPEKYIKDFINAGAYYLTVHIEAVKHLDRTVKFIRSSGARAGLALNPATPLASLEEILQETDLVVLMSVNPGFGGQEFIPYVTEKIKKLRAALDERNPGCLIEVDGGIGPKNAREIALAGADILVMGSAFYRSGDYKRLASQVRKLLEPKVRK
jgi:ribulose-phosphate 3-epimerase